MFQRDRTSEEPIHITVAAKSKDHMALIVVTKQPAPVPVKAYEDIIRKYGHVGKILRSLVSARRTHMNIAVNTPFTVTYKDVVAHQVYLPYRIRITVP